MPSRPTRRRFLALSVQAAVLATSRVRADPARPETPGAVAGHAIAAPLGEAVLRDGGNAIDAAITAAFAAGIAAPAMCGLGGYGGHAVIARADGRVTAIDFDSAAPAAARADMYPLTKDGKAVGSANVHGWLAAGVPGTLAGLELALRRHGTRSLREVLAPAIALAAKGTHAVPIPGIETGAGALEAARKRNEAELRFLRLLAGRNTAESFYRGDIADTVAAAFARGGGLVTKADLAAFRAREVAPATITWGDLTLHTAPLPAAGTQVLEALAILRELGWASLPADQQRHARLEALRIGWADRLATWGDPDHVSVPLDRLLSPGHAAAQADRVRAALRARRPVPLDVTPSRAGGTVNISAADAAGNVMAITLTHGGSHGAKVVIPELGITLGHGMSRFDPRPGFPNSVGPGKRPITNMCPTVVTQEGRAVFAAGAAGGTRIPSSVYEVLLQRVGRGATLADALAAPRLDCDGTLDLTLTAAHSAADESAFRDLGYAVKRGSAAFVSAVSRDAARGTCEGRAS